MTMNEYIDEVTRVGIEHPEWRRGQTYFNVLHQMRPSLANKIRGTNLDPFYTDRIAPFCNWLAPLLDP